MEKTFEEITEESRQLRKGLMLASLLEHLKNARLVCLIIGAEQKTQLWDWIDYVDTNPPEDVGRRILQTFVVLKFLLQFDRPRVIAGWFVGMNPLLEDESPTHAIRQDHFEDVRRAAQYYAEING